MISRKDGMTLQRRHVALDLDEKFKHQNYVQLFRGVCLTDLQSLKSLQEEVLPVSKPVCISGEVLGWLNPSVLDQHGSCNCIFLELQSRKANLLANSRIGNLAASMGAHGQ